MHSQKIKRIVTCVLLVGYILTGITDALLHGKRSFSSIMGIDINRVYFYTFILLTIGSWLLYNKWFVGIGFLALASFSSYFKEFIFLHNYFASVIIYIGILLDIITRKKYKWLFPMIICGVIQGLAFQTYFLGGYAVLCMEALGLCLGSIFILITIK